MIGWMSSLMKRKKMIFEVSIVLVVWDMILPAVILQ